MCLMSAPSAPPPTVIPSAPAPTPQEQDPAVAKARDEERRRKQRAAQGTNTLVTGGQGLLQQPNTGGKQLYGQ